MTIPPNATVSRMATQADQRLLEARMARKRTAKEVPPARSPRTSLATIVWRSIHAVGRRTRPGLENAGGQAPEQRSAAPVR